MAPMLKTYLVIYSRDFFKSVDSLSGERIEVGNF